jgi:surface antigen
MNKICSLLILTALSVTTISPVYAENGSKETFGTIFGAIGGAVIGSQFGGGSGKIVTTAIGTFSGMLIGKNLGRQMDHRDRHLSAQAASNSLNNYPDNKVNYWHNPNNRHKGNFVVTNTDENHRTKTVCRDYVHTVIINGKKEKVYGRACRDMHDPRGDWRVVR